MPLDVLIPIIVLPLVVVGGFVAYRRFITRLEPDADRRELPGARLTSESLRQIDSPSWRVVYEIAPDRLGGVDHVVVGTSGVVAIETVVADRPAAAVGADPTLAAAAAARRALVDDLAQRVGAGCELLCKVFWGSPRADGPPAVELGPGTVAVEGQRLHEWLASLPADRLGAERVDLVWHAIVTGIGRPDPLA